MVDGESEELLHPIKKMTFLEGMMPKSFATANEKDSEAKSKLTTWKILQRNNWKEQRIKKNLRQEFKEKMKKLNATFKNGF